MTSTTSASTTDKPELSLDRRWQELCNHIRTTDDTSFKLMGFVPLVSIAGIATALLKAEAKDSLLVALLSIFAASATLALWIWERRNIQTCQWLRQQAAELEKQAQSAWSAGHFLGFPSASGGRGKTQAERQLYGLTILAWLVLPVAVVLDPHRVAGATSRLGWVVYAFLAVLLGVRAYRELRVAIDTHANMPEIPPPDSPLKRTSA